MLAYWAPEQANAPARVSVVEIPSRKELRQKNLVMVSECRLHWQVGDCLQHAHVVCKVCEAPKLHHWLASSRSTKAYDALTHGCFSLSRDDVVALLSIFNIVRRAQSRCLLLQPTGRGRLLVREGLAALEIEEDDGEPTV